MKNIPHLNLNDFLSGDSRTKNEFIEQLGKGFSEIGFVAIKGHLLDCLLYTSPSPRDYAASRMPSSA